MTLLVHHGAIEIAVSKDGIHHNSSTCRCKANIHPVKVIDVFL